MATPSVLTVPSMYGDGILYSGPTVFGPEQGDNGTIVNDAGAIITKISDLYYNATSDGTSASTIRPKIDFTLTNTKKYKLEITPKNQSGTIEFRFYDGSSYIVIDNDLKNPINVYFTANGSEFLAFDGTNTFNVDFNISLKEITQGSDFDFTRATTGTRINKEGYIEDVPYNLVSYSEDFSNWLQTRNTVTANTIIAPNGTLTADKIAANATFFSNTSRVKQNITSTNTRTFSVFAKAGEITEMLIYAAGSNNGVYFNLTNGSFVNYFSGATNISGYNIEKYKDGWNRFSVTFSAANTTIEIYLSKNNSVIANYTIGEGFYLWGGQLVKGDKTKDYLPTTDRVNLPRLNYPVYGGCPSLLLEPQRTNNVTYNSQLDNASYTSANLTISANQIDSPEGISNADKLTETTANDIHFIGKNMFRSAGTYTFSGFLKKGTSNYAGIRAVTNGFTNRFFANLDLTTGEITSVNTLGSGVTWSYGVEEYSNGWFRLYITGTHSSGNLNISFGLSNSASPTYSLGFPTYTGSTSNFVYAYGFQVEAGSYPTSLIHTAGSTVTRNEDRAFNAGLGTTDTFNSTEGVLYTEIQALADDNTERRITISNSSNTAELITIEYDTPSNTLHAFLYNGTFQAEFTHVTDITQLAKVAFKYKENDFALWVNGVEVDSDNNGSVFANNTLNVLKFENSTSSNRLFFGNVKAVAVYKTALTDTELANLTSYNNHDLFIPYRSRMQMIDADQELQCTEHDITRFL